MLKPEQSAQQQQPMAPMPFYPDPNRFSTPVWQADPTQGWPQGQFIQQIPAATQPTLEGYPQQYSNGIYQATYQQPASFESNTFYAGAVQVLTRPPSAPNQTQLSSRPNGSYSHTPSPVPAQQQQTNQRTNISGQYQQDYATNNQNYVAPATTPTGNVDSSRPSSVNSTANVPTNSQNFQSQHAGNFTPISSSNFSPVSNSGSSFVNSNMSTSSGNAMPGYPPVSSHPQLASHSYSGGYPGGEISGQGNQTGSPHSEGNQHWQANWDQNVIPQTCNNESAKSDQSEMQQYTQNSSSGQQSENKPIELAQNSAEQQFSQADRVNLNSRLKTMILNKQQQQLESKMEEAHKIEQNKTGHFLSYSHHRRPYQLGDGGGVQNNHHLPKTYINGINWKTTPESRKFVGPNLQHMNGFIKHRADNTKQVHRSPSSPFLSQTTIARSESYSKTETSFYNNIRPSVIQSSWSQKEKPTPKEQDASVPPYQQQPQPTQKFKEKEAHILQNLNKLNGKSALNHPLDPDKYKSTVGFEIPPCDCLPPHQFTPEPGSYYTHLGCSSSVANLRKDLEERTGSSGRALRIEKICYTGKEGKTPQGCPIAKWIIRRADYEEKYLVIAKQRPGHHCHAAVIVVCIVAWDGVGQGNADVIYDMLVSKLNKFGLPTNRRCATNEPRTCACQGLDPDKCGASFSFGCSWSMYYNGCKYARSKIVRKFRLSVRAEEDEVEERLQSLATDLSPLYKTLAPASFKNQCQYEEIASDCRLGLRPGRPFSGVTACMDFCAHAHKDSHNMNNGCTVVVTLTKHRGLSKPDDEQLHVLPLYVIDSSDEFGSREEQERKVVDGSIEVLHRYHCEVRVRNVPQPTCRRNGKKRKEDSQEKSKSATKKEQSMVSPVGSPQLKTPTKQLQSNHVSSTVLDRSSWGYENLYYNPNQHSSKVNGQSSVRTSAAYNSNKYVNNGYAAEALKNYPSNKVYSNSVNSYDTVLLQEQQNTALNLTYPHSYRNTVTHTMTADSSPSPFYSTHASHFQQNTALNHASEYKSPYYWSSLNTDEIYARKNLYQPDHAPTYNSYMPTKSLNAISPPKKDLPSPSNTSNYLNPNLNKVQSLPSFDYFKNPKSYNPYSTPIKLESSHVHIQNPFDDSLLYSPHSYKPDHYNYEYENYSPPNWFSPSIATPNWYQASLGSSPLLEDKSKVLGQVTEVIDNTESFNDSQVGGVAIALSHGSVLFECAKHELHATTALKNPDRQSPTRISLVFYQHRNLNKAKHGWEEHEEKMRLRKLDSANIGTNSMLGNGFVGRDADKQEVMLRVPTMTTISLTTVFPMHPCIVTGPYQEGVKGA